MALVRLKCIQEMQQKHVQSHRDPGAEMGAKLMGVEAVMSGYISLFPLIKHNIYKKLQAH
jgi:hypothetical protein